MLGTNPLTLAAPAKGNDSFVLDMATSGVAVGKVTLTCVAVVMATLAIIITVAIFFFRGHFCLPSFRRSQTCLKKFLKLVYYLYYYNRLTCLLTKYLRNHWRLYS